MRILPSMDTSTTDLPACASPEGAPPPTLTSVAGAQTAWAVEPFAFEGRQTCHGVLSGSDTHRCDGGCRPRVPHTIGALSVDWPTSAVLSVDGRTVSVTVDEDDGRAYLVSCDVEVTDHEHDAIDLFVMDAVETWRADEDDNARLSAVMP